MVGYNLLLHGREQKLMGDEKRVCFCAKRPEPQLGAGGGPAGVMKLLERYLNSEMCHCEIEYMYDDDLGKLHFVVKLIRHSRKQNTFFVCHEVFSAAVLSMMRKPYYLICHSQGPAEQEYRYVSGGNSKVKIFKIRIIERLAMAGASKVYFPSTGAENMYFSSRFATVSRNEVIVGDPLYNTVFVDEGIQPIVEVTRRSDCITFLSVGTMTELKGQDLSCEFLDKLLQTNIRPIRWITVGKGPILNEVLIKCQRMMKCYPHFEHIHFDELPHQNILYLDSIADVYIMLHRSSIFDLATLEAMYNACVPVLSNIGGNVDFNVDGNCILVDTNDMDGGIELFESCNIEEYKQRNYAAFKKHFSPDCFSKRYSEMINELYDRVC